MEISYVKKILVGAEYLDETDLRRNTTKGYMFSNSQFEEFKEIKDNLAGNNDDLLLKIPLKAFNSKHLFYSFGIYLRKSLRDYLQNVLDDFDLNQEFLVTRQGDKMLIARALSETDGKFKDRMCNEIEGTLRIENVNASSRRVKEVLSSDAPVEEDDVIVRNMVDAMLFILEEKPQFNKENLKKLYNILSADCLDKKDELGGKYYRDNVVYVGNYDGAPHNMIDELMDGLFEFVNDKENAQKFRYLLPHICHYYILYVHPYFDYNGRTARMVSFWVGVLTDYLCAPLFISEAINENKKAYYAAINETRNMNNDLTYFLGYIFDNSTKFSFVYRNLEEIEKQLSLSGDKLTETESEYLKKILIHNQEGFFSSKDFIKYINNAITRQAALKVLNSLTDYGILISSKNRRGIKIFKVNPEKIKYKVN